MKRALSPLIRCRRFLLPRHTSAFSVGGASLSTLHETVSWFDEERLRTLLSPFDSPITLSGLIQILRSTGDSSAALHVFEWCRLRGIEAASPSNAPFAFQAIFEIAARENNTGSLGHLKDLLLRSIELGYTLTQDSAVLLVRSFTDGHVPGDALLAFRSLCPFLHSTKLSNHLLVALLRSPHREHHTEAVFLLSNMLIPGSHCLPDAATCSIIFAALSRSNVPPNDELFHLLLRITSLGHFPTDVKQFTRVVVSLCRAGRTARAWDLVHTVKSGSGTVAVPVWNALLTGLSKDRDTSRMNIVFSEMEASGQTNIVTYGIIINHCCKSRNVDLAFQMFRNMTKPDSGVSPDTVIFNNLIDGLCKVGRTCEALVLLDLMKTHGCEPNTITFNALIDGFCKAGDIDTAYELNTRMGREGVPPNIITLNTLISGMCKNGRVSGALSFFHEKKLAWANAKGNSITYCNLIGAFLHANNVGKAMELFDEMIKEGNSPDAVIYFTLISGLSMAGRMDDALSFASRMRRDGFQLDTKSYNILIAGFGKKKKLDDAMELFDEMSRSGIKSDVVTYNTLIDAYCKAGDFSMALTLLTKMMDDNCSPSLVTYGTLIHGFCTKGDHDGAMSIFQTMKASKVVPNSGIYNTLIGSFCKGGEIDMAVSLLDQMRSNGMHPNIITYNAILKCLCETNLSGKAFELMEQMKEEKCNADLTTIEILTGWLPKIGETDKLRCFIEDKFASVS